jgi:hypothetical protein
MSDRSMQDWEARLRRAARDFPYPPTPDLSVGVRERLPHKPAFGPSRRRGLAWAAVVLVAVLAGLMAVPSVRAAVLRALRLGGVEIVIDATATSAPSPAGATPTEPPQNTAVPFLSYLAGETTLAKAQEQVDFALRLPAYPADLGRPERVFLQHPGGPMVVLVWSEPQNPNQVRLSLSELGPGARVWKLEPKALQETRVHGSRAIWTDGPYMLETRRGDIESRRLVEGHALIWTEGEITYRLETDLSLEEAVNIAESLR